MAKTIGQKPDQWSLGPGEVERPDHKGAAGGNFWGLMELPGCGGRYTYVKSHRTAHTHTYTQQNPSPKLGDSI